jgi:hypothetical protein
MHEERVIRAAWVVSNRLARGVRKPIVRTHHKVLE